MKKLALTLFLIPFIAFAAGLTDLIDSAFYLITSILTPLAFALCVLYFFWGVVKYIRTGAGSEQAAEEGKRIMVWGIVGLFVVFSIWGIISFIKGELGLPNVENPRISKSELLPLV
jgi:hypothetical protein